MRRLVWLAPLVALGCGNGESGGEAQAYLDRAAMLDPETCKECHATHHDEWAGSMHAYAGDDPVFRAMNARGQRETNGALGDFCVKCHAPIAVREGLTKDGTNLDSVPAWAKGVGCYFCHSVDAVTGTHDAAVHLADDLVMRGGLENPLPNRAHRASYSALHDRNGFDSTKLCGACHDIVSPAGAHLERTYAEWQASLYSHTDKGLACGQCHMDGRDGIAATYPGVGLRRVHGHGFPGVDVALGDFPGRDGQRAAVQQKLDDSTLQAALCVSQQAGGAVVQVVLDNVGAGHRFPSGATQDRRAWVEVIAYAKGQPIYQSGVVPDGQSAVASADADMWLLRDCIFDGGGKEVHSFWEAASYDGNSLPAPITFDQASPDFYLTHVYRNYPSQPKTWLPSYPDRVTMRVRIRPMGLDVLDGLVASGDLDPSVRDAIPTFDLGSTKLEWTAATATVHYTDQGALVDCVTGGLPGAKGANPAPAHSMCAP